MTQTGIQFQLNQDKFIEIKTQPSIIYWDDDKIFMASKKGYSIISKKSGDFLAKVELTPSKTGLGSNIAKLVDTTKGVEPFMAVNRGRCLVVSGLNKRA